MNHAQQHAAAGYRVSSPVRNFASVWTSKHAKNLRFGAYSNHVIYKLHHQLFPPSCFVLFQVSRAPAAMCLSSLLSFLGVGGAKQRC